MRTGEGGGRRVGSLVFAAMLLSASIGPSAGEPADVPRLVFNNDATNWTIFSTAPGGWRKADAEEVKASLLRSLRFGLVDGIDAVSLSPQIATFPFWRSALYPLTAHDAFLASLPFFAGDRGKHGSEDPSPMRRFLDRYGDLLGLFFAAPLSDGTTAGRTRIVSFRVNDQHYNHLLPVVRTTDPATVEAGPRDEPSPICDGGPRRGVASAEIWGRTSLTAIFAAFAGGARTICDAPGCPTAAALARDCGTSGCVLTRSGGRCPTVVLDFGAASVRAFRLRQIEEIVRTHPVDHLELDFDRFPMFFRDDVPTEERIRIVTDWIRSVRAATPGVVLGLRVPSRIVHRSAIGIDLTVIERDRSADYAILAMPYFTDQSPEVDLDPRTSRLRFLAEVSHETGAPMPPRRAGGSPPSIADVRGSERFTTSRQLITAAHLARARGFHGTALFNMQYYLRPARGAPAVEYPARAVACSADAACAGRSDQEYVLPVAHYYLKPTADMLPFALVAGAGHRFSLRMAKPWGGWRGEALISVGVVGPSEDAVAANIEQALVVEINGRAARPSDRPWPEDPMDGPALRRHQSRHWLDRAPHRRLFVFDRDGLREGENSVRIGWNTAAGPLPEGFRVMDFRLYVAAEAEGAAAASPAGESRASNPSAIRRSTPVE